MNSGKEHIINILEKEYEKIEKDNERLLNQIETSEDMIHNYNLQKIKNHMSLNEISKTILELKDPS